jgi:hypothetical protein
MTAQPLWEDNDGDVNDYPRSVPDATGADWGAEGPRCDWCEGILPEWETGLYCSATCRAASQSDRDDTNPTWIER